MKKILLLSVIFLQISCTNHTDKTVRKAFYFWRSVFELSTFENDYLNHSQINKLYLKYFDIDWNEFSNEAVVVAPIQFVDPLPDSIEVVPTVFITNRTLLNLPNSKIDLLYNDIVNSIDKISQHHNPIFNEIQLDCDWTPKTQLKYFKLLTQLQNYYNPKSIEISVTLRLHQYKYPDFTGIPPVSRCMLMFYNMGDINILDTDNSIIDINIAKTYLNHNNTYPLELDIVLPLFSWGVIYRMDKVVELLNNISVNDLDNQQLYQYISNNNYSIIKNHYLGGSYLYKGDKIKIEDVKYSQLLESAELLSNTLNYNDITIAFFSLTQNNLKDFSHAKINKIIDLFN